VHNEERDCVVPIVKGELEAHNVQSQLGKREKRVHNPQYK